VVAIPTLKVSSCGISKENSDKVQKQWGDYPMNYGISIIVLKLTWSALESILISVTTALDVEMAVLRKFVNELLTQLEEDIDRERLRNMLVYSKKLSAFEKKATLIRDSLAEILDNGKILGDTSDYKMRISRECI
jgi:hypothetical protein